MASTILKRTSCSSAFGGLRIGAAVRYLVTKVDAGTDIVAAAPNVSLQKARSWDEGVSSNFATTPLKDIFKDKKVVIFGLPGEAKRRGVCLQQHVPSYKNNIDKFKAEKIDSVICVSIKNPHIVDMWAMNIEAKDAIEFYGDPDGSFHKSLGLVKDLTEPWLSFKADLRNPRWSALVVDGRVKVLNVEENPSEFKVSGAEVILKQI
ncbi:peroxiredoxin-2F, mitochondrial isoform X2 [Fagus crenata]